MTKTYSFKVDGTNHEGRAWTTRGYVNCEYFEAWQHVNKESFEQLTQGKAIYGQPGLGCEGPYGIHRVVIEEVKQ